MRLANKTISHSRIVEAPLMEDVTHAFNDYKIFLDLDPNQGHH